MNLGRLKGDKDILKLIENFFSLSAIQLINLIIPLVTLPYVIRTIHLKNYGVVVLASAFITFFDMLTDYSFKVTGTRDVSVFRNSKIKMDFIYSKVTCTQIFLLIVSMIPILGIIFFYRPFAEEKTIFLLTIPMLWGYTIFPDWFFQGVEDMKYLAIINASIKVFFTFGIFIFMKKAADYWMYPLFNSLGYLAAGFIGQYIILKKYRLSFKIINRRILKRTFKANFAIFVNQFVPNFYNGITTIILGILTNSSLVGLYDAIKKIIDLCLMVITTFTRVFFPYLARKKHAFRKYAIVMLGVNTILTIMPILLSTYIFKYLSIHEANDFKILVILSIGIFFYGLYNIYGLNYFILKRMDKDVMRNTLIASITGLVLAYPLIKTYDVFGAAANLTLARIIMGGGMIFLLFKKKNNDTISKINESSVIAKEKNASKLV